MKVIFQYKDNNGQIDSSNNLEKEMTNDEILVLLNSKEVSYPVNSGLLYISKHCIIESSVYDMFTEPYKMKIILKEK
ncbi:MAG: hypothetical protein Q8936_09825 [Bacillota bacterium]|nr:hypothetical protein [Bacillota bacterium]